MNVKSWLIKQYEESPTAVWFLIWISGILTITGIGTDPLFIISYLFATPFFGIAYATILAKRMNVNPKRSLFGLLGILPLLLVIMTMINGETTSGNDLNNMIGVTWILSSLGISSVYKGYKKNEKNQSEDRSKNGQHSKEGSFKEHKGTIGFLARHPILCYLPIIIACIYFDAIVILIICTCIYTFLLAHLRNRSKIWGLIPFFGLLVVSSDDIKSKSN